jgi:hypothetical protein
MDVARMYFVGGDMEYREKCLDFLFDFENILRVRPGMLGGISEISAMFYVVDNMNSILTSGEALPPTSSWFDFLVYKKLVKNNKSVPIEEGWNFDRFIDLRRQYLDWLAGRNIDLNTKSVDD